MLTRFLFLMTLVLGSTVLLTGAWTGSFTPPPQRPEVIFVSQTVALDADIVGSGIDATRLLEKAVQKIDPQRTPWLKTKIRQTMTDAKTNFVAETTLQRGPNHCARLEMDIGKRGRLLVVSDGELVAQVRKSPGSAPEVRVEHMPAKVDESADDGIAKEKFLIGKSCGGPAALLQQLQQHLQNGKLQTGLLHDIEVIQISGELNPEAMPLCARTTIPVRHAYVYLDAKTLWPHAVEWWGVDRTNQSRVILRVEFLEPELNCPLSDEECMRIFSYRPDDGLPPSGR
jgi:hypothetical protein